MTDLAAAAAHLRQLHHADDVLVLANVWDAATASLAVQCGFPVVATSSGGVAQAHGYDDHEHMPAEVAFAALATIARSVAVPVTADVEAGYGLSPRDLVDALLAAGAVGCNLEDTDHHGAGALADADAHAQRLADVKAAGRAAGIDLVVNARVDAYLLQVGSPDEQRAELVRRGRLYLDAGADCVYPIGIADEDLVAAVVDGVAGPVNILARPGVPSLERLRALGVARVSVGTGFFRLALGEFRRAAQALHDGDFERVWPTP
jgi:2-methylisocitrate lyase-like PEP mutase family enzyme